MTPETFRRIEKFFHRAMALPAGESKAFLDAECPSDEEVRAEVEKLLAQADPEETLEVLRASVDRVLRPKSDDASSDSIGPAIEGYQIIREIHRGGQGVVYQATQSFTRRKVAIKVLLEGPYASKSAERRFEREIELVASLKHPNVISIFHSGKAPDGRQYYVMDYVRGVPIHHFVRDHKLTIEETLKLFQAVCDAVNYAHQKGVIHRDLKPSNILVDAAGMPKVLDFGLAKMVGGPEETLISVTGQVVGTLPYMSPEQARGNPDEIDIRTDVYALGVVLYEMLTGRYPYPVVGQMADVLKHIAETAPTPPSRNWTSDSGVTKRSGKRLRVGQCPIDDEVQTVVLRTLAKDRERRYQSAGELQRDIGHYLANEPIEAKRDSSWYLLKKSLYRYRVPVVITAVFVLLVGASAVALGVLYNRTEVARQAEAVQRREAQRQATIAQAVTDFLNNDLLGSVHPVKASGREVTVREVLDVASGKIERQFDEQPAVEAQLRQTIGDVYSALGKHREAQDHLERTLALRLKLLGEDSLEVAETRESLALLYGFGTGDLARAVDLAEKVLLIRQQKLGERHALTILSLGDLAMFKAVERGESAAGMDELTLKLMATWRGKGETTDQLREYIEEGLIWCQRLWAAGEHDAVLARYASEVEPFLSNPQVAERVPFVLAGYALRMLMQDRAILAESLATSAVQVATAQLQEEHPNTIYAIEILGRTYWAQHRYEEAEELLVKAIKLRLVVQGPAHPQRLGIMRILAALYREQGSYDKAEGQLLEAHEAANGDVSSTPKQKLQLGRDLIELYDVWGKPEQAAEWREKLPEGDGKSGDAVP